MGACALPAWQRREAQTLTLQREERIMRSPRQFLGLAVSLATLAVVVTATPAHADLLGIRGGVYTKLDKPFVGVELISPITHDVFFNPNAEYVFIDNHTYLTFNGDFHYDFRTRNRAFVWLGGGLAVIYQNPEGPPQSSTDVGANFLFGIGLKGEVIPYLQAKLIAKEDTEFVVSFGLRF